MNKKLEFNQIKSIAQQGGGEKRVQAQHAKGKLTARERLALLLDPGTFVETDMFVTPRNIAQPENGTTPERFTDGVVTGWGKIDGRLVYVYAQDFTILGGSLGESHGLKIARLIEQAHQNGSPVIGLNDSGGARIQEGVDSLAACGEIFTRNVQASGIIPQIAAILGPCAGAAVYSPALMDFVFMEEENSYMFLTGPDVVRAVTHEDVDTRSLGGAEIHAGKSGVAHFVSVDEESLIAEIRLLFSYLPSNNLTPPPILDPVDDPERMTPELEQIVPYEERQPYDVKDVITSIVDEGRFLEVQREYAQNIVVGFARMDGHTIGVVANQPLVLAGVLDIDASDKAARFIRFCDSFHIPLVTLVDTPGFLPGTNQEAGGVIRHGAKMIFAYAEATVPKVSLIMRKAFGGAYIVMSSKHLRGDLNFAWPDANLAVMGPEGAVNILYRRDLANAEDADALRQQKIEEYRNEFANPYIAASRGYLNDVIPHAETRKRIVLALETLQDKRQSTSARKHGNIPL
ncbi:MAG: methylmalonyl-CoA carboxyltransferase [Gammaproteobacteria bacterium]|nr:methylmalonyl-CoA carboxyltransferase [Gammaproteobacteria bacterium]